MSVQPGDLYQHYLGGVYRVVGIATHEGTHRELIILAPVSGTALLAVDWRDWVMVLTLPGRGRVPRFVPVEAADPPDTTPAGPSIESRGRGI